MTAFKENDLTSDEWIDFYEEQAKLKSYSEEDILKKLYSIENVKNHMNKEQVKLGKEIFKTRLSLELSHKEVLGLYGSYDIKLKESDLKFIESGNLSINIEKYKEILNLLNSTAQKR